MMIKNVKHVELNISIAAFFLEYTIFEDDLIEYKCLICNKSCQKNWMKNFENDFLMRTNFLTMIVTS